MTLDKKKAAAKLKRLRERRDELFDVNTGAQRRFGDAHVERRDLHRDLVHGLPRADDGAAPSIEELIAMTPTRLAQLRISSTDIARLAELDETAKSARARQDANRAEFNAICATVNDCEEFLRSTK